MFNNVLLRILKEVCFKSTPVLLLYLTREIKLVNGGVVGRSEGKETSTAFFRTKATSLWVDLRHLAKHMCIS